MQLSKKWWGFLWIDIKRSSRCTVGLKMQDIELYTGWVSLIWNAWDQKSFRFQVLSFWNIFIEFTGWPSIPNPKFQNALKSKTFGTWLWISDFCSRDAGPVVNIYLLFIRKRWNKYRFRCAYICKKQTLEGFTLLMLTYGKKWLGIQA